MVCLSLWFHAAALNDVKAAAQKMFEEKKDWPEVKRIRTGGNGRKRKANGDDVEDGDDASDGVEEKDDDSAIPLDKLVELKDKYYVCEHAQ